MQVLKVSSEYIQGDLNKYASSLAYEPIEVNSLSSIEDQEQRNTILNDIKNTIAPKLLIDGGAVLSFSEKHNKLIVLFSKLDQDKSVNAAAIGQQLDELISGKLEFRLIVQSYEKVQAVIRDNIELKTLMISSREIKKFEGDNQEDQQNKSDKAELNTKMSLVQLLLYTQKDFEENRRERVQKVFGSEILSSENIGLDKSKVDEFYYEDFEKYLKNQNVRDELLKFFGITEITIKKNDKQRVLIFEMLSSKSKDFTNKKIKDQPTIHKVYKSFKKFLKSKIKTEEFEIEEKDIDVIVRFPRLIDNFKYEFPGSKFSFETSK